MDRSYEKSARPTRDLRASKAASAHGSAEEGKGVPTSLSHRPSSGEYTSAAPNYQRAPGTRSTALFIVISGGAKREKDYLRDFEKTYAPLRCYFYSPANQHPTGKGQNEQQSGGSEPHRLIEAWQQWDDTRQKHADLKLPQQRDGDKFFLFTDLDYFRYSSRNRMGLETLLQQYPNCEEYEWIISNPCFEMWLYYSSLDEDPRTCLFGLASFAEEERPKKLKGKLAMLVKGGVNARKALGNRHSACERAEKFNPGEDEQGIPRLYGTQMPRFIVQLEGIQKMFKS